MANKDRQRATLKQVAQHAGVSPMTVSNYANGRYDLMTSVMREKVAKSVAALNYRRNFGAHSLRTSRAWSIGIIVVDNSDHYLSDGYTTQIIAGVTNYLNKKGFSALLQGVKPEDFTESPLMRNLQTDGLCVLLSGDNETRLSQFNTIRQLDQPIVSFLEAFDTKDENVCVIKQDEIPAGRKIAECVLARDSKSVVILTTDFNEWAADNERVLGMTSALQKSLATENITVVPCGDCKINDVQSALTAHISLKGVPDAIMCINDEIALAAISLLKSQGISIPREVCVTGFNAFGLHQLSNPPLTTVRSPAYEMGTTGARELLHCLETGQFRKSVITFPAELIQGSSV